MGSDRSKRTFDERRQYRRVIPQQGRVFVEADGNESQEILTEEMRKTALALVGPCGTPDNGYAVGIPGDPASPFDLTIGRGTMFVGGMRAELFDDTTYFAQPDRMSVPAMSEAPAAEIVYLELTEQEVSAVEDKALREVALGGPDTAARTRLVQRIVRRAVASTDCKQAFSELIAAFESAGRVFDPATMSLRSGTTLKVEYLAPSEPQDLCSPVATIGYLGAENQLLCAQISGAPGPQKLLWAMDNASSLYRVRRMTVVDQAAKKVALEVSPSPPDAHRAPKLGQVAELLGGAVSLGADGAIAERVGLTVVPVTGAYDPVERTFVIQVEDLADFPQGDVEEPLYVRLWEEAIPLAAGAPLALGDTGVRVVLQKPADKPFVPGDHWLIGVRPAAPQEVWPRRLAEGFQPPDGARAWVCPLAVVTWHNGQGTVARDCRVPLLPLSALAKRQGCCTVSVGPEDVLSGTGLQALLDSLTPLFSLGVAVKVCLRAGTYLLSEPLRITSAHSGATIEGCGAGAVLAVADGAAEAFIDGMIVLSDASQVAVRGIRFQVPDVDFDAGGGQWAAQTAGGLFVASGEVIDLRAARCGVGVRVVGGDRVSIQHNTFVLQFRGTPSTPAIGAAVLVNGGVTRLAIENNDVLAQAFVEGPMRHVFGVAHVPVTQVHLNSENQVDGGFVLRPALENANFRNNVFDGVTVGTFLSAETGAVLVDNERVRAGKAGLWSVSLHALASSDDDLSAVLSPRTSLAAELVSARSDGILTAGSAMLRAYPLPSGLTPTWLSVDVNNAPLASLHAALASVEKGLLARSNPALTARPIALRATNNDMDTTGGTSGRAVFAVWDTESDSFFAHPGELLASGNRWRANADLASALVVTVQRCAITGCHVLNEAGLAGSPTPNSLVVVGRDLPQTNARVAVTGNVLRGQAQLPPRAAGLPAWVSLNHEES